MTTAIADVPQRDKDGAQSRLIGATSYKQPTKYSWRKEAMVDWVQLENGQWTDLDRCQIVWYQRGIYPEPIKLPPPYEYIINDAAWATYNKDQLDRRTPWLCRALDPNNQWMWFTKIRWFRSWPPYPPDHLPATMYNIVSLGEAITFVRDFSSEDAKVLFPPA